MVTPLPSPQTNRGLFPSPNGTFEQSPTSLTPPEQSPNGRISSLPSEASTSRLLRRRSSTEILRRSAWPQALTVCFVFVVTFTVFPGVTSRWRPSSRVTWLIATFQLLDVAGRTAPQFPRMRLMNGPLVSLMAALRVLFVPIFMLLERVEADWTLNPALQYLLMVGFAFSNGYVSTLSMMLGPGQSGLFPDEQEPAGIMMSFFLVFGIFLGSLLALPTQIGISTTHSCA